MKLAHAADMRLDESKLFLFEETLLEDGEGPRWKFRYDNWHHDPTPDVLLLGAWHHPNTGNNLVGGINIHYLDKHQIHNLARALPQIMGAGNLKARYWKGRQLVPDVFNKYYRTYDAKFIRGVSKDVMFPKFGFLQTAKNWLKKTLGGIFKSKQQRQKDSEPRYPDDLADMQQQLDGVVANLQRQQAKQAVQPQAPEVADTPEMRRARDAFLQYQRERAARDMGLDADDVAMTRSYEDYIDQATHPDQPEAPPQQATPQTPQAAPQAPQTPQQPAPRPQQPQQPDPRQARERLAQDRLENQQELENPNNDVDLGESIAYYSPVTGGMIVETLELPRSRPLVQDLLALKPLLAAAAQRVYDEWEQSEAGLDVIYGGGGICDAIAHAMAEVLVDNGINYTDGGHDGDDHAFLIAYDTRDSFIVDVNPGIYESGMGMVWAKIPDAHIDPDDVSILKCHRPDWIDEDYA